MRTHFASHAESDIDLAGFVESFDPFRCAIELDGVRVNLDPDEHGFVVLGGPVACEECETTVAVFERAYPAYTPDGANAARCPHCMATFPLLEGR